MKGLKDETGNTLTRLPEFKKRTDNKFVVMDANGAPDDPGMRLGFDGYIPKTGLADLSQAVFDLWNAGKHKEAFDMFAGTSVSKHSGVMQYF